MSDIADACSELAEGGSANWSWPWPPLFRPTPSGMCSRPVWLYPLHESAVVVRSQANVTWRTDCGTGKAEPIVATA